MSKEYQNATEKIPDLHQNLKIWMGTCQRCGRCFKVGGPLDGLMMTGYRVDNIDEELWIYRSKSYLETDPVTDDIQITVDDEEKTVKQPESAKA